MLTYTINKIMKTLEIAVFLSVGVMVTGTFVITPCSLCCCCSPTISSPCRLQPITYDTLHHCGPVEREVTHGDRRGARGCDAVAFLRGVFCRARPSRPAFSAAANAGFRHAGGDRTRQRLFDPRTSAHFWQSRPGTWLIVSSIADLAVVALMATIGVLIDSGEPVAHWRAAGRGCALFADTSMNSRCSSSGASQFADWLLPEAAAIHAAASQCRPFIASHTLRGVAGMSMWRTPL